MIYFELTSKTISDIIGITLFIWKQHNFEIIFTSNYVLNIQYEFGKSFGSREREYSMVLNAYFYPRIIIKHTHKT